MSRLVHPKPCMMPPNKAQSFRRHCNASSQYLLHALVHGAQDCTLLNFVSVSPEAQSGVLLCAQALIFAAYLYAWDVNRPGPIEPQLFASAPTSVPIGGAAVTFNVLGCLTLSANTQYVAFLSSSGYWLAGGGGLVDTLNLSVQSVTPPAVFTFAGNYTANFTTTAPWIRYNYLLAFNVTYA